MTRPVGDGNNLVFDQDKRPEEIQKVSLVSIKDSQKTGLAAVFKTSADNLPLFQIAWPNDFLARVLVEQISSRPVVGVGDDYYFGGF